MRKLRSMSILSMVIIGALLLSVFGTASVLGADEGFIISKDPAYSTQDREFIQDTDTIYMKIWSSVVGDDPKIKKWEITDSQAHKESGSLSADGDSSGGTLTFEANTLASNFAVGDATLKMKLQSGKNKYEVTETITILVGGPQPPPAPSWIEPDSTNENTPHIYWESVTDPNGDIVYYSIKIGTTSGGEEFLPEQSTGTDAYYDVITSMSDGTYHVNVKSSDGVLDSDWNEETIVVDTVPPIITEGPTATPLDTTAVIEWTTNELSDSTVEYGLDTNYGLSESDSTYVLEHSITLTSLTPETIYHYRVGSKDQAGNGPTYSGDNTFTTLPSMDKWTFMVYLDGDNSLSDQTTDDLDEMQSVGSTDDVNIVVLEDKLGEGNTRAYYVNSGSLTDISLSDIDPSWVDEVNMGDPNTLSTFAIYMITNYPASHYLLDLWDHGNGLTGVCQDETSGNDWLTMGEVDTALTAIKAANSAANLDILGYDACLMGMIECSYEVYGLIDYFVASEEVVPWDGWPYDDILGHLTATPTMSPADLSTTIVNDYLAFYSNVNYVTMSALDMSKLPALADAIDNLANILFPKCETDWNKINRARRGADSFQCSADRDIYDFAKNIKKEFSDPTIKALAQNLMDAVDNAIIAEGHGRNHRNAHGVSIWFPDFYLFSSYYYLDFAVEHQWDEFLDEFISWYGFG